MNIDWEVSPEWADAVISDLFGNLYWVEKYGGNSIRQELGMDSPDPVMADTSTSNHTWELIEVRPKPTI